MWRWQRRGRRVRVTIYGLKVDVKGGRDTEHLWDGWYGRGVLWWWKTHLPSSSLFYMSIHPRKHTVVTPLTGVVGIDYGHTLVDITVLKHQLELNDGTGLVTLLNMQHEDWHRNPFLFELAWRLTVIFLYNVNVFFYSTWVLFWFSFLLKMITHRSPGAFERCGKP